MLYSPSIVDASYPALPLLGASCTIWAPGTGIAVDVVLPLMSAGCSLLSPSSALGTSMALPLMSLEITNQLVVVSKYASLPSTTTGVYVPRKRSPNPHSPVEVRRAIQAGHQTAASQTDISSTINVRLSEVESLVAELDGRLDAVEDTTVSTHSAVADENIAIGQLLYMKSNGHVALARANAASTMKVCGFATTAVSSGFAVKYNTDGRLSIPDWTAIIGSASLTPGSDYYLSTATAGLMTAAAPTATGSYVVRVGNVMSTVIFDIEIESSILL